MAMSLFGFSTSIAQVGPREFHDQSGRMVMKAMEFSQEGNFVKATEKLKEARALDYLNSYEISTIETMMGMNAYEQNDLKAAIVHFRRAIESGGLSEAEVSTTESQIAQLLIANGQYMSGAQAFETWIKKNGSTDPRYIKYTMQAYMQAEAYKEALPWAETWFAQLETKERIDYDHMHFLYNENEMRTEQQEIIEAMLKRWPQDRNLWDSKISLLAYGGREKEAYLVLAEMYEKGLLKSERDLMRLVEYHAHYGDLEAAQNLLWEEMANGRISNSSDNLNLLDDIRNSKP